MLAKNLRFIKMKNGFTLIELLVVISIISIIFGVVVIASIGVQREAKNSRRKTDLSKVQQSLQQYYTDHGFYPTGGLSSTNGSYEFKAGPSSSLTYCIGQPGGGSCTSTRVYLPSFPQDPVYPYSGVNGDCRHYCYTAYKNSASAGDISVSRVRNSSNCDNTPGNQCQYYELSATTEPNSVAGGATCPLPANFIQHECDTGPHLGNYVVTPLGELTIP